MSQIVSSSGEWDAAWPWPQVKFLQQYVLGFAPIVNVLWLYEMKITGDSWEATPIMAIGDKNSISVISVADFGAFFALSVYDDTNELLTCWIRNPNMIGTVEGAYRPLPTIEAPNFIASCNYNGQCLIGGIEGETSINQWQGLKHHTVAWSSIGHFSFRIQDQATAGNAPVPFGQAGVTKIWKILQLDTNAIVYANEGTVFMTPMSAPAVGWSVNEKFTVPVIHPQCVDGGKHRHAMIDKNYELWTVTSEGWKKLGFKEFLQPLFGQLVRVVYEPQHDRFYISNGLKSYVVTSDDRLYECHQCVTSIGYHRGVLSGFFVDTADYEGRFFTNTADFAARAIKVIRLLEVGYQGSQTPKGMVKWRNTNGTFSDTPWKTLNMEGVVFPNVSGIDFLIGLKVDDYRVDEFSVDYLQARLQLSDKRFIRGSYAFDPTTGRAGS